MLKEYIKAFKFFAENKTVVFLIFLVSLLNSPLKSNGLTMMGAFFLSVFFVGGFLGVIHRVEKGKIEGRVGVKSFIIEAGAQFSYIVLSLFEVVIIVFADIIFVTFFAVLPMIILQTKLSTKYSQSILTMIIVMVVLYRLPIILYSYFTVIVNKTYGKQGIAKLKEIIWESPAIWVTTFVQGIVYLAITALWFSPKIQSNIVLVTSVDIIRAIIFMYFMTVSYFIYVSRVENNERYKEILQSKTYDGRFKSFSGRFIM